MPTIDEIRARNVAASACKHEEWSSTIASARGAHSPSGCCTVCGKTCAEVYRGTSADCPVCRYFKTENATVLARFSDTFAAYERNLARSVATQASQPLVAAPPPSENMPEEIRVLYEDARRVSEPRSANALLRIACEDLCRLNRIPRGRDGFYGTISNLREREGISSMLANALDSIRITGNAAVHGNETDYDIPVEKLFNLVNIIVDEWAVSYLYDGLPDEKKVPRRPR